MTRNIVDNFSKLDLKTTYSILKNVVEVAWFNS